MGGALVGQIVIPIPMLGALAGNLVGSTIGAVMFEGVNQTIFDEQAWDFMAQTILEATKTKP